MSITAYDMIKAAGERTSGRKDDIFVTYRLRKEGVMISVYRGMYQNDHIVAWFELEYAKTDILLAQEERVLQRMFATETDNAGG